MIKPKKHNRENERLKYLESYSILDTLPEIDYDNLTAIASEICNTPISLVSIIDNKRQWFKSHHGLSVSETPKEYAFCAHAINDPNNVFIVQDARKDDRFFDNPLVTGEPHVIFYAGVPLIDSNQLPLGTLCVIDHEPKLLSQSQINSLKALSNQIMNLLELRKTKIHLEKSLEDILEKNRDLESFAYIAAHDLKSPLNNISSLTYLLNTTNGGKIDVKGQEIISHITNSVNKLRKLIDGLLEYSKSKNILKENKTEINLLSLKNDIEGLFNFKNDLIITIKSSLQTIVTNRTALYQILINLVSNSIKYNNKTLTEITIEITENETEFIISVEDNGPGISKENHNKAFQIFEVLSTQDKFGQRGNGIGLATVKKLVEEMGGKINIESDIGTGANFIFNIVK